jgi:hypothetical protein
VSLLFRRQVTRLVKEEERHDDQDKACAIQGIGFHCRYTDREETESTCGPTREHLSEVRYAHAQADANILDDERVHHVSKHAQGTAEHCERLKRWQFLERSGGVCWDGKGQEDADGHDAKRHAEREENAIGNI